MNEEKRKEDGEEVVGQTEGRKVEDRLEETAKRQPLQTALAKHG